MLAKQIAQAIEKLGHKGALALVFWGAVGTLMVLGAGLVIAALLMGMAIVIGAIWASLVLGLLCLAVAAGLIARRPKQTPPAPAPPLEEIVFTLAFVAARAMLQDRP